MATVHTAKHLLLESTTKSVESGTYDVICQFCTVEGMVVESEVLNAPCCALSKLSLPRHSNDCLITKLDCLVNESSHMKHVCRSCLTAFSSQPVLIDHIDRCQKQKPTNITFSWKDQLKFEDYHKKVNGPIIVYADFECINQPTNNPNVFIKQTPIAVGFYLLSQPGSLCVTPSGKLLSTWLFMESWFKIY